MHSAVISNIMRTFHYLDRADSGWGRCLLCLWADGYILWLAQHSGDLSELVQVAMNSTIVNHSCHFMSSSRIAFVFEIYNINTLPITIPDETGGDRVVQREPSSQGEEDDEEKSVREPLTRPFSEHSNLSEDGSSSACDKRLLTAEGAKPPKSGMFVNITNDNHKSQCCHCDCGRHVAVLESVNIILIPWSLRNNSRDTKQLFDDRTTKRCCSPTRITQL